MHITNLRPTPGAGGAVALFDIDIAPGLRLINWQLRRAGHGFHTFPPRVGNGPPAVITEASTREIITAAAVAAYGGQRANERSQ